MGGPGFLLWWLIVLICYPLKVVAVMGDCGSFFGALIFVRTPFYFLKQIIFSITVCASSCVSGISDVGIAKLGDGLPFLQSLDVSRCIKLSDKGLKAVALGCQKLRHLHITGCRLITDNLLLALSKSCLNWKILERQDVTA